MLRPVGGRLSESLAAFRSVFSNPGLRRLELAWGASETGKWFYVVALAVFAYDVGGASDVALSYLIRVIPAAVAAPFAGVLADRYSRRLVMLATSLLRAAVLGAAAAAVVGELPAGSVYGLMGLATLLSTAFRPAQAAILPALARTPAELTAANVSASTIASVGSFAGPALGGLLLAGTDVETVFAATGGLFLVSALLVAGVGRGEERPRAEAGGERFHKELVAGFATIARDARLRVLVGLYTAQTLVAGALFVLIVVIAKELLDLGDAGVGYLNAAFGVGGFVGTALTVLMVARQRLASGFGVGMLLWGVPLIGIAAWLEPAVAVVLVGVIGVGDLLVEVAAPTLLQRAIPDEVLARVFGAVESLLIAAMGIGALAAPLLIDGLGERGALVATGCFLPALAVLLWRPLRAIDREARVAATEARLLRGVPMFALVPQAALEQLAGRMTRMRVEAGEVVFRQGDPGDRFYVVAEGEVEVSVDRKPVRSQGPGDHFGEIALLRDVPRTATVTATSPTALYALEREDFIAAVTGHPESLEAAEAAVSTRLAAARPPRFSLD